MIPSMIPIIPPEEVEETKIKKIKKDKLADKKNLEIVKTEKKEETKAIPIEGKEEKKRAIIRKQREKKEKSVYIGPLVPRFITAEKEHIHEKPIIPSEYCCNKLCKNLNDEIFVREESLGAVTPVFTKGEPPTYKGFFSIPYVIEALKDYRYILDRKNICKCYEETKEIEAPLPEIKGEPAKLTSIKTGRPIVLTPGVPRFELPKTLIHIIHRKDIPVVPIHDGCCIDACNVLTKKISKMENMLDKIELRGGKALRPMLGRDPRYEALAYKTFALQEYRSSLTKKNICKCLK